MAVNADIKPSRARKEADTNERPSESGKVRSHRGLRWAAGANVTMAVVLAVALVAVLQWGGYTYNAKADLTSSGINSLSEGTEKLIESLDTEVTITSTYFESDIESPAQGKFRQAVRDLIDLYQISNPSKLIAESVNPLQDHQQRKKLLARLREIPKFKEQADQYETVIDSFRENVTHQLADRLAQERTSLAGMTGSLGQSGGDAKILQAIEVFLSDCQKLLTDVQETVQSAVGGEVPDYSGAVAALRTLYNELGGAADSITKFAKDQATRQADVSDDVLGYLNQLAQHFEPIAEQLQAERAKAEDLPKLELDNMLQQFSPTGNCLFVSTASDARIIPFAQTWPAAAQGAARTTDELASRDFRGEEKISSAILQITQEKKPAVVFVRYGGPPLFLGGFRPGMPRAPYMRMRQHLEDLNFTVEEWDVSASTPPPTIDPQPERIVYVVLRPSPPPQPMRGQPPQTPFGDPHRKAVLDAIGENGRALFIVGWMPGQFGLFPTPYEYGDYLKETWGIEVQSDVLLLKAVPIGPNEFRFSRGPWNMAQTTTTDHVTVQGLGTRRSNFPWVAPLRILGEAPENVQRETLLTCRKSDGLWGVKNVQAYEKQYKTREFLTMEPGDLLGPFTVAAAATRQDAKIVVVSSRDFAQDSIAFATVPVFTGQGIGLVNMSPSNVTLFVNTLHWLNDNTQWMNLGRPIESQVIEIEQGPALTFVHVLAYAVWPALALVCGGAVWLVRRS